MDLRLNQKHNDYIALIPFGVFLFVFIFLNIIYKSAGSISDNFPMIAAFTAIISSFFTFKNNETINEKVAICIQGSTQSIIMHMCYIFYISTVFTAILDAIGGIAAVVKLCLYFIPTWSVLPGIFIVSSLFSFTVGTSMGAIAAFMPIAMNITTHIGLNHSLMAATIVCGAMFGDNLSILSDTTIAALKITDAPMEKKLALNAKIAAPAFILSLLLLTYQNYFFVANTYITTYEIITVYDLLKIIPYAITFYFALKGIDITVVLTIGTICAIALGLILGNITLLASINLIFDGFYAAKGMVNVFILVLLLAGLSNIITHNGGIAYIIKKMKNKLSNKTQAQLALFILINLINMTIAINTISILITGPIAKQLGDTYKINPSQTACILDIGSCISQGILPYAPQILLAASMAHVSTISLLPYVYYQYLLTISLVVFICYKKEK